MKPYTRAERERAAEICDVLACLRAGGDLRTDRKQVVREMQPRPSPRAGQLARAALEAVPYPKHEIAGVTIDHTVYYAVHAGEAASLIRGGWDPGDDTFAIEKTQAQQLAELPTPPGEPTAAELEQEAPRLYNDLRATGMDHEQARSVVEVEGKRIEPIDDDVFDAEEPLASPTPELSLEEAERILGEGASD